jgi:hypothetical protein
VVAEDPETEAGQEGGHEAVAVHGDGQRVRADGGRRRCHEHRARLRPTLADSEREDPPDNQADADPDEHPEADLA